jgi:Tol biopolymer transport system component
LPESKQGGELYSKEDFMSGMLKPVSLITLVLLQILSIGPQMIAETGASPILFEASSPGEGEGVYIMDANGNNQRKLNITTGKGRAPTWSRDGCRILFWNEIRKPGEKSIQTGIYVMNADGSGQRPVIGNVDAHMEQDLRSYFSPDGSRIVYIFAEMSQSSVMVAKLDGSDVRKLTEGFYAFQPSWSPDGSKILFGSNGRPPRIRVMNADGTNLQDIGGGSEAKWSPDGTKVVFCAAGQKGSDVAVMNSDGTNIKVLTGGTGMSLHPSWSPDGTRIAFQSVFQDDIILEVINVDGTSRTKVADHLVFEMSEAVQPSWSPDGFRIAFARMPSALKEIMSKGVDGLRFDIYTANANGSDLTRLTTSGMAAHPVWSPAATCKENR